MCDSQDFGQVDEFRIFMIEHEPAGGWYDLETAHRAWRAHCLELDAEELPEELE
jgi:hypothetical protein